jgi:hypothetical protein
MHLDSQIIEGYVSRSLRLGTDECEHLQECEECRNAVRSASAHIAPKRLFDLAQMDVIFDELEWPHLSVCDACSSRFTTFLQVRVQQEKKLLTKSDL